MSYFCPAPWVSGLRALCFYSGPWNARWFKYPGGRNFHMDFNQCMWKVPTQYHEENSELWMAEHLMAGEPDMLITCHSFTGWTMVHLHVLEHVWDWVSYLAFKTMKLLQRCHVMYGIESKVSCWNFTLPIARLFLLCVAYLCVYWNYLTVSWPKVAM